MSGKFREDINGLRAVAVVAVVLFHLGVAGISGGFLGVDIFFVISGYLISSSILKEVEQGHFSFRVFYYRRARRLFPAMLVTVAVSLTAGIFIFTPIDLIGLGKSALFSLIWLSNFFFWVDTDYFTAEALTKPLLHLWSLAVEEQFYLFWPMILVFAYRMVGLGGVFWVIAFLSAFSVVASEVAVRSVPLAAFFLTPFRVFEFAIGGLVVFTEKHKRHSPLVAEAAVGIGLISLAIVLAEFSEQTPFPGVNALVVCIATAMLIHFGPTRFAGVVIANPLTAYIGRISYSLYLVHWPLVVFYRYAVFRDITATEKSALFAVTLVFGTALYYLVENRFRYFDFFAAPARAVGRGAIASVCVVTVVAGVFWLDHGLVWRSSSYFASGFIDEQLVARRNMDAKEICRSRKWKNCWDLVKTNRKLVLILGDSHGPDGLNMIMPALSEEHVILNHLPGCPPIPLTSELTKRRGFLSSECVERNRTRVSADYLAKFDVVVVSVLWGWYKPDNLRELLDVVHTANPAAKVIIFGNYFVTNTLCWQVVERTGTKDCFVDRYVQSKFLFEEELRKVTLEYDAMFFSKKDLLCRDSECQLFVDNTKAIPFTWDKHHLSYDFAHQIGVRIEGAIRNFVYSNQNIISAPD